MLDLQAVDRYGRNALHKICAKGDFEKYTAVIEGVTDFTARTNNGSTYLHYAVTSHSVEICRDLLSKGLDPADAGHSKGAPMHLAADCYDTKLLALFIEHGTSPNILAPVNATPLVFACSASDCYDDFEPIEFLLSKGADINPQGTSPLHVACTMGDFKLAKYLISKGADVNGGGGESLLSSACLSGDLKLTKFLIENGADVNQKHESTGDPLVDWVETVGMTNSAKIVKLLKEHGAKNFKPD